MAAEHYLQVTDAQFARAIRVAEQAQQKTPQQVQASMRNAVNEAEEILENSGFTREVAQGDINLRIPPITPNRIRTGVCRLRICCPRPLDDGGDRARVLQ